MSTRSIWIAGLVGGLMGASLMVAALGVLGAFKPVTMPVAVVNLAGLIKREAGDKPMDDAAVKAGFAKMRAVGEALADKGYLVLDASAVINAPEGFYVPKRDDQTEGAGKQ